MGHSGMFEEQQEGHYSWSRVSEVLGEEAMGDQMIQDLVGPLGTLAFTRRAMRSHGRSD